VLKGFGPKFLAFRNRYCVLQEQMIAGKKTIHRIVGSRNTQELNLLLTNTVMVRRLKKDVLAELPDKRRQKVPLEVPKNLLKTFSKSEMTGSDMVSGGEVIGNMFLNLAKAKLAAVKEYVLEVMDRGDDKVIIFAHHKIVMDALSEVLQKRLAQEGRTHMRIDGGTSQAKRELFVKQFQTEDTCRVAVLSITACSEGLTLTAAGLVIFAELYWVPGAIEQAEARAHRIGSTHSKVVVEFLVASGSPDEQIYNSLERKKKDTSRILNGTMQSLDAQDVLKQQKPVKRPLFPCGYAPQEEDSTAAKHARVETDDAASPRPVAASTSFASDDRTPDPVPRARPVNPAAVEYLLRAARDASKDAHLSSAAQEALQSKKPPPRGTKRAPAPTSSSIPSSLEAAAARAEEARSGGSGVMSAGLRLLKAKKELQEKKKKADEAAAMAPAAVATGELTKATSSDMVVDGGAAPSSVA
jgi:superfamily II DNA/RNA helicase